MSKVSLFAPHASWVEKLWFFVFRLFNYGILLFLILPIIVVMPLSFSDNTFLGYPITGFSLRWYEELVSSSVWIQAAKNSFIIAPAAALLATILGVLCAIGLNRATFTGKGIFVAVILSPIVTPVVVVAVGMYFFFNMYGLTETYVGLIIAHAVLGAPLVVVTVTATLKGLDQSLVRASLSMGASPLTTFRRVVFPLISPGILTGAVFAFALSFDEVVVTLFLAGPTQTTIPRQMFSGIRDNINPTILALASILVLLTVLIFLALEWLKRKSTPATNVAASN